MTTDISSRFRRRSGRPGNVHWSWALLFLVGLSLCADAGVALRLSYDGIPGGPVSELTRHPSFPDRPGSAEVVTESLEKLTESRDAFGTWTRGYLEAPQTGDYHFMVAADDTCEFWLSTSHRPEDRRKIAENIAYVSPRNYHAQASQRSIAISLAKGEQYYFELFHKDHIGYDHISVGWQLPDGTVEAPISAGKLMPFPVDNKYRAMEKAPAILREYFGQPVLTLTNVVAVEGSPVTFSVTVEATPPVVFQWFHNREAIPGANLSRYTLPKATLANDTDLFTVTVSNPLGKTKAEAILRVVQDLVPPTIVSSLILTDSSSLAVFFSEAVDPVTAAEPGNYLIDGLPIREAARTADPRLIMLTGPPAPSGRWRHLGVRNVKDQSSPANRILPGSSFVIESGIKTWLTFENSSHTNTLDLSGDDRVAQLMGNPELPTSKERGRYMLFDGVDDCVVLESKGMSDFVAGVTVALWARPSAIKPHARFIDFGNGPRERTILFGRLEESNNLIFYMPEGSLIVANGIELNVWQHFAASLEPDGTASIYKNGSLLIKARTVVPTVKTRLNNFVGRSNFPNDSLYEGAMDDIRIYARPLTPAEIKVLAAEGEPR